MSQYEEVERYRHAQRSHDWRDQWWKKTDATPMLTALAGALSGTSDKGRLVAQRALKDNGMETLWLCVTDVDANGETVYVHGFDISWPCPPGPC